MRFSRKTDYGLIFLEILSHAYKHGAVITVRDVSEKYGVPYSFLEKVALDLKTAGIIVSKKGKGGGYVLARSPKRITMREMFAALERPKMMRCLESGKAKGSCLLQAVCPTRKRWQALDKKILEVLRQTTLAEI
ncbi:Rrf2 family transcriptional regulator [Candidatus Peregrinibacteria bacterium]|nr:Rrf2 family transcriptional regulator [Candidatus Peregrinibacteria bacterium]